MICGAFARDFKKKLRKSDVKQFVAGPTDHKVEYYAENNVGLAVARSGVATIDDKAAIHQDKKKGLVVAASGNIFGLPDGDPSPGHKPAEIILDLYHENGIDGFRDLNGQFAAAIWDEKRKRFLLVRDHLGFEPLYYHVGEGRIIFSSSLRHLSRHTDVNKALNYRSVRNYLLFNFSIGLETILDGISKVRPGSCLFVENNVISTRRYWYLSYRNQNGRRIEDYIEDLRALTTDAIRVRTRESGCNPGAFLSGGMDSSSVVGLLSGISDKPVHTFSFRCAERDVDESYFARVMASHYGTKHHEVQFTENELANLEDMAGYMDEPLCDIGIELGSFILGREAEGNVRYILTGDGGDELYAGHPVYVADRMALKFDKVPAPVRFGITAAAQLLPDSDHKKSLLVKTRRFAYSYGFPRELLSNRWRIYYNDNELSDLCTQQAVHGFAPLHNYSDITDLYSDADGRDLLSRSLYGDYQTLVRFHVDRLRLTRAHGIEARFPLHDYRLIEFSATIPAELKINGSTVKFVQKKAMEGVLPDEIVFRKDKMGHNVPMKNWMRKTPRFRELLMDTLSESKVRSRGLFRHERIQEMMDLHLRKKKDYSHRLYSLLILELWLQKILDA